MASDNDAEGAQVQTCPPHHWHRPSEDAVKCLVCKVNADEFILGLRADESTGVFEGTDWNDYGA